ncbi:hypothetical protein [Flagellimonas pacifica]|uniref:Co-chaperone DjlA N-terminal domain-containing protein n=1 Tax=Flagellimonas pacifica TaxID=1247520 RepID=A0A285MY83_9FLAO|nr:hypothetical protein [Allomuricauda parva]SNZ00746.1 hypothetical protein SAMN06265377_2572 [Allomuricauda parva]
MKQSQIEGNEFYENLGKLFYYIAMADKSVRAEEIDKLKTFIRKYWLDVDDIENEYGEDAAFQIEAVFNRLLEYEADAEGSFGEFKSFYTNHKDKFNSYIKVLILDTSNAIANTVYGKNKAELIALANLQLLFQ